MIKIGGGSAWAAIAVGAGPYVIRLLLHLVSVIGCLAALTLYLRSDHEGQQAMERFIAVSTNAVVSILTLKLTALPEQARSHPRLVRNSEISPR